MTRLSEDAILAGCSVGAALVPAMYHLHPNKTKAMILCDTGYSPNKEFAVIHSEKYA